MTREYRGKCVITNQWVYGYYFQDGITKHHKIYTSDTNTYHLINPLTLGQYIGVNAENGNHIFEGDFVYIVAGEAHQGMREFAQECIVEFKHGSFIATQQNRTCWIFSEIPTDEIDIWGNIHDNSDKYTCFFDECETTIVNNTNTELPF